MIQQLFLFKFSFSLSIKSVWCFFFLSSVILYLWWHAGSNALLHLFLNEIIGAETWLLSLIFLSIKALAVSQFCCLWFFPFPFILFGECIIFWSILVLGLLSAKLLRYANGIWVDTTCFSSSPVDCVGYNGAFKEEDLCQSS